MRFLLFVGLILIGCCPALALDPPACIGQDLYKAFQKRAPQRFAELEKEADVYENARGLLWKIEKPGVRPSYLFGTMHSTDPRIKAVFKRIEPYIARSSRVLLEIDLTAATPEKQAQALGIRAFDPSLRTLSSIADEKTRENLRATLQRGNIPDFMAERARPWFLAIILSLPDCENKRIAAHLKVLDRQIAERAHAGKIAVIGLETIDEQLDAMASIPESISLDMMRQLTSSPSIREDLYETLVLRYLTGQVWPMMLASRSGDLLGGEKLEGMTEFMKLLVDNRNLIMRDRALGELAKGNAFMAVGALHLPGPKGLVSLLKAAGYTVKPMRL